MFGEEQPWFILTFDLHTADRPEEIQSCLEWLASRRLSGTFFIPTEMLGISSLAEALSPLRQGTHELGSHSHLHDQGEVRALRGDVACLSFLARSLHIFVDYYDEL